MRNGSVDGGLSCEEALGRFITDINMEETVTVEEKAEALSGLQELA